MSEVHVARKGEGQHFQVLHDLVTIKAPGQATSGQLLVLEATVPPGDGAPPLHRHESAEAFYILEGEFEIQSAGADLKIKSVRVSAGDTTAIPSMAWHTYRNVGQGPGRFLAIHSPSEMEGMAREAGIPVEDPRNPPIPQGPPSAEEMVRLRQIVSKYVEILPPDQIPH